MLLEKDIFLSGVIISIGYGVVNLQGFLMAFVGEVFAISLTKSFGLVVNLYHNDTMNLLLGALLLHPRNPMTEGTLVKGTSRLASILMGDFAIGAILDPLGNLLLNSARVDVKYRWLVESPAPGIIDRQSVFEPLQTGVLALDAMIPVGRGQRELILGDRQTGKTSLGVDTILNHLSAHYVSFIRAPSSCLYLHACLIKSLKTSSLFICLWDKKLHPS